MPWTEHTLRDAEAELWNWAAEYFGGGAQPDVERIDQEFRLVLHRLALAAWEAHVTHWSPSTMGIDPEVLLEEERDAD